MGTNWFMPALVNSRLGLSGMRLEDGTMVCCFDLKKSRKSFRTWLLGRICELVIMAKSDSGRVVALRRPDGAARRPYQNQAGRLAPNRQAKRVGSFALCDVPAQTRGQLAHARFGVPPSGGNPPVD